MCEKTWICCILLDLLLLTEINIPIGSSTSMESEKWVLQKIFG
jgi:hypothetical protein